MLSPKIRFSEFTDEWTQDTIKNLSLLIKDGSHGTHKNSDGPLLLSAKNVQNGFLIFDDSDRRISQADYDLLYKNYQLMPEDILLTVVGSIGRLAIIKSGYPAIAFQRSVAILRFKNKLKSAFSFQLLQGSKFQKELLNSQVVSAQPGVYLNVLSNISVDYPSSLPEQEKIAEFFTLLDRRIEKQREKVAALHDQKKGLQQRIFAQELVFKDDNGNAYPEWEEVRLEDHLTESRIKGNTGDTAKKITVKIRGKGVVPKRDSAKGSENTQYYIRKSGQLIYGKLDFLNCAFGIIPDSLDGYESTVDLPSFDIHGPINPFFLLTAVMQEDFYKKNGQKANGTRIAKRIHPEDFLIMPILMPTLKEQTKIATFLSIIDAKINKEIQKMEILEEQKKGYMQQMFV